MSPDPAPDKTQLAEQRTEFASLRSHMANERTHLAYVRTSIALIGFGITLNRFAIFLIQQEHLPETGKGLGKLHDVRSTGLGMVLLGTAVLLWAVARFRRTSIDIDQGRSHHDWRAVLIMSTGFLLLGVLVTFWLFLS